MIGLRSALALVAITLITLGSARAQGGWPQLGESCLPVAGKMKPVMNWATNSPVSPTPACHCPPASMCPQNDAEWAAETRMPSGMAEICCKRPYECTVEYVYESGSHCPSYFTTKTESAEFCMSYAAVPSPSTWQTIRQGTQDVRVNPVENTRNAAANQINACLAGQCRAILDRVVANQPKAGKKPVARDSEVATTNGKDFAEYVACEHTCRLGAAATLGLPASSIPRLFPNALLWGSHMIVRGERSPKAQSWTVQRHADFVRHMFKNGWRDNNWRAAAVEEFKSIKPAPVCTAGSGLEGHLSCNDRNTQSICYGGFFNNGSCSSCLAPGTLVELSDGTKKAIELIGTGDLVKGQTGVNVVQELITLEWQDLVMYRINDGLLQLTADHPLMTKAGWKAIEFTEESSEKYGLDGVGKLEVGDVLITDAGEVRVESIEALPAAEKQRTYNLKMKGDGTFYANGVVVKDNVNVD